MFFLFCTIIALLTISPIHVRSNEDSPTYDVIIMGAGWAGLSAANTLYNNGITNILVIEGQDYIGGRQKSIHFNGYELNIGASWIHGACTECPSKFDKSFEPNPMLTLADKYNLDYVVDDWDSETYFERNGEPIKYKLLDKLFAKWDKAVECVEERYLETIDFDNLDSYTKPGVSYREALTECGWKNPTKLKGRKAEYSQFVEWYDFDFEYANAPEDDNAYSELGPYTLYGPEDLYTTDARGGYAVVVKQFAADLQAKGVMIVLNERVTSIEYTQSETDSNSVTVYTANGRELRAKYGIVTFSIGVLQSDMVSFEPSLPDWKSGALHRNDIAFYTPMYVVWPYDFWSSDDPEETSGEQLLFIDEERGYFVWSKNLDHPKYFPGSKMWRFDIDDILAKRIERQPVDETIYELIHEKLLRYFDDVPQPVDIAVADWSINEFTRGSYGYWPVDFSLADWHKMQSRVSNVFFAGEALSFEQQGYVSGAYLDGIRAAKGIAACLQDEDSADCPSEWVDDDSAQCDCKACEKVCGFDSKPPKKEKKKKKYWSSSR